MSDIRSVIRKDDYKTYIDLICADKGVAFESLSDFELFAFLCDNIASICGSPVWRELEAILSPYVGANAIGERGLQKRLWRVLNGDDEITLDIAKERIWNGYRRPKCTEDKSGFITLNRVLNGNMALPERLDDLIEAIADSGKNILIDLCGLEFERPDEYHSELIYAKILRNEHCSPRDRFNLIAWIICRATMRRNARLYILPDKELSLTSRLIELMNGRRLYPPTFVVAREKQTVLALCELCLSSPQKNISLVIAIPKETDENITADIISSALELVPITRLFLYIE